MKNILNNEEIELIKISGRILKESLLEVVSAVKPGISALELDQIAYNSIISRGAEPSFKGYEVKGIGSFPATLCVSINDEVVHGIPTDIKIADGDLVSLDIGARYKGICTDMAVTVAVGKVSFEAQKLVEVTKKCLELGIEQAKAGKHIGDIGYAVQKYAEENDFGVVRDLVGHGIGREAHLDPHIPNFGKEGAGPKIEKNMALAIEPMLTLGDYDLKVKKDGWTVVTRDGSLAAHFEHTVVVTDGKPLIVTA